jgi:glycerol-1-phosphate dehydrogenase [NAD(P)+]
VNRIWNLPKIDFIRFAEIEETRPVFLVTSRPAWNAVKDQLRGLNIMQAVEVSEASLPHWDALLASQRGSAPEMIMAVGGGLAADAGKYLASQLNLPLTCLPTALSVDAFLTAASGIRRDGCVYYISTTVPENLLVDFEVIGKAPLSIRAAGITDVLSIATGAWDWKFAHEQGKNPPGMGFIPWIYENVQSILRGVLDCAEAAGGGDREGLKFLLDCLCLEVQLCNQIGHARPEEGSEHYFAYAIENEVGPGLPHGDLVGPGILLIARLQGQALGEIEKALTDCHVPLEHIPQDAVERTLKTLPAYCRRHNLPFGIAHTL